MRASTSTADESLIALARWLEWEARDLKARGSSVTHEDLPTAPLLAKSLGLDVEAVKKRLSSLRQMGLVQVVEQNPKRYRFDLYGLKKRTVGYLPPELETAREAVLEAIAQGAGP